ncbi:MAG: hypothetical protein IT410_03440 [Candidatus Doudnabacteria bacterium]|nr:hypothetical protein [Candidatus Doudnabacteria bacterium]
MNTEGLGRRLLYVVIGFVIYVIALGLSGLSDNVGIYCGLAIFFFATIALFGDRFYGPKALTFVFLILMFPVIYFLGAAVFGKFAEKAPNVAKATNERYTHEERRLAEAIRPGGGSYLVGSRGLESDLRCAAEEVIETEVLNDLTVIERKRGLMSDSMFNGLVSEERAYFDKKMAEVDAKHPSVRLPELVRKEREISFEALHEIAKADAVGDAGERQKALNKLAAKTKELIKTYSQSTAGVKSPSSSAASWSWPSLPNHFDTTKSDNFIGESLSWLSERKLMVICYGIIAFLCVWFIYTLGARLKKDFVRDLAGLVVITVVLVVIVEAIY